MSGSLIQGRSKEPLGRALESTLSSLGIGSPTNNDISAPVLDTGKAISSGGNVNEQTRAEQLEWDTVVQDTSSLTGTAAYYKLAVDAGKIETGFFLVCRSTARSKFKVVVFSQSGEIVGEQDSRPTGNNSSNSTHSEAVIYFTKFNTYDISSNGTHGDPSSDAYNAIAALTHGAPLRRSVTAQPPLGDIDKTLSFFDTLNGVYESNKAIQPGQYVVAVQHEGLLSRVTYSLAAVVTRPDMHAVSDVISSDQELFQARESLHRLKDEYQQARAAYLSVLDRSAEEERRLCVILEKRCDGYSAMVEEALQGCANITAALHHCSSDVPGSAASGPSDTHPNGIHNITFDNGSRDGSRQSSVAIPPAPSQPAPSRPASSTSVSAVSSAPSSATPAASRPTSSRDSSTPTAATAAKPGESTPESTPASGGNWFTRQLSLGKTRLESIVKSPSQSKIPPPATHKSNTSAPTTNAASAAGPSKSTSKPDKPDKPRNSLNLSVPPQSSAPGITTAAQFTPSTATGTSGGSVSSGKILARYIYMDDDEETFEQTQASSVIPTPAPPAPANTVPAVPVSNVPVPPPPAPAPTVPPPPVPAMPAMPLPMVPVPMSPATEFPAVPPPPVAAFPAVPPPPVPVPLPVEEMVLSLADDIAAEGVEEDANEGAVHVDTPKVPPPPPPVPRSAPAPPVPPVHSPVDTATCSELTSEQVTPVAAQPSGASESPEEAQAVVPSPEAHRAGVRTAEEIPAVAPVVDHVHVTSDAVYDEEEVVGPSSAVSERLREADSDDEGYFAPQASSPPSELDVVESNSDGGGDADERFIDLAATPATVSPDLTSQYDDVPGTNSSMYLNISSHDREQELTPPPFDSPPLPAIPPPEMTPPSPIHLRALSADPIQLDLTDFQDVPELELDSPEKGHSAAVDGSQELQDQNEQDQQGSDVDCDDISGPDSGLGSDFGCDMDCDYASSSSPTPDSPRDSPLDANSFGTAQPASPPALHPVITQTAQEADLSAHESALAMELTDADGAVTEEVDSASETSEAIRTEPENEEDSDAEPAECSLNTTADFADALDFPAHLSAHQATESQARRPSKANPLVFSTPAMDRHAVPTAVWDPHPAVPDQTPIPMVWEYPASPVAPPVVPTAPITPAVLGATPPAIPVGAPPLVPAAAAPATVKETVPPPIPPPPVPSVAPPAAVRATPTVPPVVPVVPKTQFDPPRPAPAPAQAAPVVPNKVPPPIPSMTAPPVPTAPAPPVPPTKAAKPTPPLKPSLGSISEIAKTVKRLNSSSTAFGSTSPPRGLSPANSMQATQGAWPSSALAPAAGFDWNFQQAAGTATASTADPFGTVAASGSSGWEFPSAAAASSGWDFPASTGAGVPASQASGFDSFAATAWDTPAAKPTPAGNGSAGKVNGFTNTSSGSLWDQPAVTLTPVKATNPQTGLQPLQPFANPTLIPGPQQGTLRPGVRPQGMPIPAPSGGSWPSVAQGQVPGAPRPAGFTYGGSRANSKVIVTADPFAGLGDDHFSRSHH